MRFLMLAAALAITAPPALGQVRPELPEWAREWNAPDRPLPGLAYDLAWDEPRDDRKEVRWKPILVGAGTGLALGYAFGWWVDETATGTEGPCIVSTSHPRGPCLNHNDPHPYEFRMVLGLNGLLVGGIVGWIWALIEAGAS